ncbi:dixin isoform X2 [Rhineura floridana]|uniref:dixin isoform X2 n=1 Tax=Rhineura floridana TaxID=261503 RepID=UPI002AC84412|nr:dixin isoform X2 [Rhineura floridana]XP_061449417.1 dixin isoform X2 [Rhineura floridana]
MGTLLEVGCRNLSQPSETSQQLQAYVAWVNSQLKKKPAVKPVQDLRQDLRDGVILASLIEIVAGEKLNGVEVSPTSPQEMRENVEKVLQFVASKKIRMHQTSAKDIVDGNLKCIMRLILALAAHFKPGSSKVANQAPSSTMGKRSTGTRMSSANHRPHSAAAVAQGAVAALADVRHDVSRLGRDVFRHRRRDSSLGEETEHPYWSVRALVQQYEEQQSVPSESHSSSLASPSPVNSARSESSVTPSEEKAGFEIVREEEADTRTEETGSPFPPESQQARCPATGLEISWEEQLLEQQDHLEKEMEEAKKMISGLQALLLNGSLPEDEQERSFVLCEQDACPGEQLIIVRSRLDQSIEENQELKKELQRHKQEARSLQGIKPWLMFASFLLRGWHRWRLGDVDALQQRLAQQDALILQIKQELLRAKMDKEELHSQNVDLQRKVEERNRLLVEYKKELGQKDRHLHQHQAKMEEMLRQLSEASYQQAELERELQHKEALLAAQCMKKDAEEVIVYSNHGCQSNGFLQTSGKGATSTVHRGTNDLQLVREALRSLRNSFSGHDPQHHTIDSLEQGISSLMERLHRMEMHKRQERRVQGKSPASHTTNDYREPWPSNSKLPHSHSTPAMSSSACTKVLYFTDRSLTPFMVNIPKRLGEVTLRDFKAAIDREGTHRYHFKALDPEFGTVKEEVFHDDDIIPGWEGKIVAWVEEDHGEN